MDQAGLQGVGEATVYEPKAEDSTKSSKDLRTMRIQIPVVRCPMCSRTNIKHTSTHKGIRTYVCNVCCESETMDRTHWRVEVVKV